MSLRSTQRGLLACLSLAMVAPHCCGQSSDGRVAVEDFLKSYTAAFNEGDTQQLAEMWAEDATWQSTATGEAASGREAILADFSAFFEANPGARLSGSVDSVQVVTDGVVCVDGQTTLATGADEALRGTYTAVLKANDDRWQLARVVESAPPVLDSTYTKLQDLEFLVGEWQDEGDGPRVTTNFRWGTNQTFLIRAFTVEDEEGESQGTQVIGWDPKQQCVRSWTFHSDGSFGEGTWSHAGQEWTGRMSQTLADGSTASATQVVRMVDDDTLEVETVGREVAGEPLPAMPPVRMVRVAQSESSAATDTED